MQLNFLIENFRILVFLAIYCSEAARRQMLRLYGQMAAPEIRLTRAEAKLS
jgi:hypothetical protein